MPIHDWSRVDAGIFHHLHLVWIARLNTVLNEGLLPDRFYALAEPVMGEVVPDVITIESEEGAQSADRAEVGLAREGGGESAVALAPGRVVVQELGPVDPLERLARRVVVKDSLRDDRVVAVIELVSAANKSSREKRDRFVEKSVAILSRGIHALVVDVQPTTDWVHEGFHAWICRAYGTESAALAPDRPLQAASYQALDGGTVRAHVVPLAIGDVLPGMPLFLLPRHFVRTPLEQTYAEAFASLPRRLRETLALA
ncbi:MAG: DUF4058 family protein [Planctomycetes bacterium]|nr:DUF4058 family protein [Planctomycetota bacterium]